MIAAGLALLPLLLAAGPAPAVAVVPEAEPLGFHARADKASVRLGEPFGYQVEIRHRPGERYVLHGDPELSPFRADGVRCRRDQDSSARGEVRTTCTMQLSLFALGPVDVPDLVFDVDRAGGKARLAVPGPRITGTGMIDPKVPAAALALRDIAPPAPLLVRSYRLLWWSLGAVLLAAAALAAVRALRRARGRRVSAPGPTPAERFERRLRALEAERLFLRGQGEEHVDRLAEAVREYLGAVSGLPALELTSAELLAELRTAPDGRLDLDGLERFLAEADGVKFARWPPRPDACAAGLEWARALLERTRTAADPGRPGAEAAP